MSEIDPKLQEGLRALAADGPLEAPAGVEERLLGELRKRSRSRRRNRWLGVGTAAIAAGIVVLLWTRPSPAPGVSPSIARLDVSAVAQTVTDAALPEDEDGMDFYRLPDTDDLPPMESATVIRVQMPMASLRLIGLPVSEEQSGDAIQADVLVGQDGLARGVRLVE